MPHISDGQIHAYLDRQVEYAESAARRALEAHVAECDECASRLEGARSLRDRAGSLLRHADPGTVTPPPFDAIVDRRGRAAPVPKLPRGFRSLAWAASVVLALAVGMYARPYVFRSAPQGASRTPRDGEAASDRPTQLAQQRVDATEPRRAAPSPGPGRTAPGAVPAEEAAGEAGGAAGAVEQDEVLEDRGRLEGEATLREAPANRQADAGLRDATRARERAAAAPGEVHVETRNAAGAAETQARRAVGAQPESEETAPPVPVIVDGLPVDSVTQVVLEDGRTGVRVVQRLESGAPLELIVRLALAAAQPAPAAVDAPGLRSQAKLRMAGEPASVAAVMFEGYEVTGSAEIPVDSLRMLLGRLRLAPGPN